MQLLYRWLIYGNFWIALGAAGLTYANSMMIYGQVSVELLSISFLITLAGYNLQRIRRGKEINASGPKDSWLTKNTLPLVIILLISFCSGVYFLIDFSVYKLIIFTPFLFIVTFYRWPVLGVSLRDIPFVKILLISFCWAFITIFLPDLFFGKESFSAWVYILASFLYIVGITIPFDSRDAELDQVTKKTIPQLVGKKMACFLAVLILLLVGLIFLLLSQKFMFLHCLLSAFIVSFAYKNRPDWYYSFILDGLLVIIPLYFLR